MIKYCEVEVFWDVTPCTVAAYLSQC